MGRSFPLHAASEVLGNNLRVDSVRRME